MKYLVHDIEVFNNGVFIQFRDESGKDTHFHFGEFNQDFSGIAALADFLYTPENKERHLVGFNSLNYDEAVLAFLIQEQTYLREQPWWVSAEEIYDFNEALIGDFVNRERHYRYKLAKPGAPSVDIFRYWSMLTRKSQKISLKSLLAANGWPDLREMEFHSFQVIKEDELPAMYRYLDNDVRGTEFMFTDVLWSYYQVRKELAPRFNRPDFYSKDGVNIGSEMLFARYQERTGVSSQKSLGVNRGVVRVGDLLPDNIFFDDARLKAVHQAYQQLELDLSWENLKHRKPGEKSFEMEVELTKKLTLTFGVGGIHSQDRPGKYTPPPGYRLVQTDVGSYYPFLIAVYNCLPQGLGEHILTVYWEYINERFQKWKPRASELKKVKKENTLSPEEEQELYLALFWADAIKLVLNGVSGNLKNPHSWLRDPAANVRMTVTGQLLLTMLAEWVLKDPDFEVISLNTDGIEAIVPENRYDDYVALCKEWENHTGFFLEHDGLDFIFRENVNSYFAVAGGQVVKRKGLFKERQPFEVLKPEIINQAIINYVTNQVPVEDTIHNGESILDYCLTPRMDRKFEARINDEPINRHSRVYASTDKDAGYLLKVNKLDYTPPTAVWRGVKVMTANHLESMDPPKDIDYRFYRKEAIKRIESVTRNPVGQLTLFG